MTVSENLETNNSDRTADVTADKICALSCQLQPSFKTVSYIDITNRKK